MTSTSTVKERLNTERHNAKNWRELAARYGVPQGVICDLANRGKEPHKPEYRIRLGLPIVTIVHIVSGNIPEGCQVLGYYLTCKCGKRFVPNHPRRKKCFDCGKHKEAKR